MKSLLDDLHDKINAIGGTAAADDRFGAGVNHAVDKALAIVEAARASAPVAGEAVTWRSPPTDAEVEAAWKECTFPLHYDDVKKTIREAFNAGYRLHRARSGYGRTIEAIARVVDDGDTGLPDRETSEQAFRKAHVVFALALGGSRDQMALTSEAADGWAMIQALRAPEGHTVTICCDNPDFNGEPNSVVTCCGDWTGWEDQRFTGETLIDAMKAAATARAAAVRP